MVTDDHLSNDVSIKASLEKESISLVTKSRAIAAFDRLLGTMVDVPIALLENIAVRIRTQGEVGQKLLEGNVDYQSLPDAANELRIAIESQLAAQQINRFENKRKVVEKSIKYLEGQEENNAEVGEDWLNYFEEYAEKATSERMRDLWAMVMAGEIRKPRSFSLTTIRFLSELDKNIAEIFQRECEDWLGPVEIQGSHLL